MHAFDVLGHAVRRRILEILSERERSSGEIVEIIGGEFGITQSAVSQHLGVLRDFGFASVRVDGARRVYAIDPAPLLEIDGWLERFRDVWNRRLDALETEVARGKSERREAPEPRKSSPARSTDSSAA